jgi:hypothetical protein
MQPRPCHLGAAPFLSLRSRAGVSYTEIDLLCVSMVLSPHGDFAMVDVETKTKRETPADTPAAVWTPEPASRETPRRRLRVLPFVITAAALAVAGVLSWAMWQAYMGRRGRATARCAPMS